MSETSERRQPEDTVRAVHLAFALHAEVRARPRAKLDWRTRVALRQDPAIAQRDHRVRDKLLDAMAESNPESQAAWIELVKCEAFGSLSLRAQLDLLQTARVDADVAADLMEVVSAGVLSRLPEGVQSMVARLFARHERARSTFVVLLQGDGLALLSRAEQSDLLRYIAGPELPSGCDPDRERFLNRVWDDRRQALVEQLEELRNCSPPDQAELLRDVIYLPCRPIYFLEAMQPNGRAIIAFDDPSRSALSYAQVPVFNRRGRKRARIESPDRCVASRWLDRCDDAASSYAYRLIEINRDEERRFVEWIEATHCINELEREQTQSLGPRARHAKPKSFWSAACQVVEIMNARGGGAQEKGHMIMGEICTTEVDVMEDAFCDQMIEAFLAA